MKRLRQTIGFSFRELELYLFQKLQEAFGQVLREVICELDEMILDIRDKERFKVKDTRNASVPTLFGDVPFRRRYYEDVETEGYVYLLDEVLGVKAGQASPCLATAAAIQAVIGPSYRAACESLKQFYGYQIISHETIRQLIVRMGKQIEHEEAEKRQKPEGKRRVPVIFIEADGYWVPLQKHTKDKLEVKMMVAHEGWQRKTPGSKEYELINKTHYVALDSQDFWENASRHLYCHYDIDEETMVVINGDRAPWIRQGVEHFPKAIYQADRYHVKRDLRRFLRGTEELEICLNAFDKSDVKTLLDSLTKARAKIKNSDRLKDTNKLLQSILKMPDSFRDYRKRLKEIDCDYDISIMRGMGAAESSVNRFSNRLKKRGQSWRPTGLKAMVHSLVKHFEGTLQHYAKRISRIQDILSLKEIDKRVSDVSRQVAGKALRVKRAAVPIKGAGTIRSGGLSNLFLQLDHGNLLIT